MRELIESLSEVLPPKPLGENPPSFVVSPVLAAAMHNRLARLAAALEAAREDAWLTMESCPVNQRVLLWNQETCEISIGYKPEDAPTHDAVVVGFSASWADAWRPMPSDPESETYNGPPLLSVVPAIDQARGKGGGEVEGG